MSDARQEKTTPEDLALQLMCKELFKSKLFRGYYNQRCYVDSLNSYRDVVVLQKAERELESLLLNTKRKLCFIYDQRSAPNIWVGVTNGSFGSYKHVAQAGFLDTCIWVELSNLAFGEYWFQVRTLKFRDKEVLLKLKVVRPVDSEPTAISASRQLRALPANEPPTGEDGMNLSLAAPHEPTKPNGKEIDFRDFQELIQQWGISIKQSVYDFMAHDINKANILSLLKFIALLVVSILTGAVYALRFLGLFTLRFMFECSRFTHAATPLFLKVIEVFNKCIGGILILLMTIWKDFIGNRGGSRNQQMPMLTYNGSRSRHQRSIRNVE